jgi:beta-lactamase superfamily II metal-dependent hydrolase
VHELDLLPVGRGKLSGDAIALRFTRPDTGRLAHVVVDAGYPAEGPAMVEFVRTRHRVERIDLAVLTHPDPDHIGGMAEVLSRLQVEELWIHRLDLRGGDGVAGGAAVRRLVELAERRGTRVVEPFAGRSAFGGALRVLGPGEAYYDELARAQGISETARRHPAPVRWLREAYDQVAGRLPFELPFDEHEGTTERNDSSVVLLIDLPGFRAILPSDAGVPALTRALDEHDALGLDPRPWDLVVVPHHGSKRNASGALLDRLVGRIGEAPPGLAFVSAAAGSPWHPAFQVVRAYERRGREVRVTAGQRLRHASR